MERLPGDDEPTIVRSFDMVWGPEPEAYVAPIEPVTDRRSILKHVLADVALCIAYAAWVGWLSS